MGESRTTLDGKGVHRYPGHGEVSPGAPKTGREGRQDFRLPG